MNADAYQAIDSGIDENVLIYPQGQPIIGCIPAFEVVDLLIVFFFFFSEEQQSENFNLYLHQWIKVLLIEKKLSHFLWMGNIHHEIDRSIVAIGAIGAGNLDWLIFYDVLLNTLFL